MSSSRRTRIHSHRPITGAPDQCRTATPRSMTDQVLISSLRQLAPHASVDTAVKRRFAATTWAARPGDQHGQGQAQGVKQRILLPRPGRQPAEEPHGRRPHLVQPAAESDSCGIRACRGIRQALLPTTRTSPTTSWPPGQPGRRPSGANLFHSPTWPTPGLVSRSETWSWCNPAYGSGARGPRAACVLSSPPRAGRTDLEPVAHHQLAEAADCRPLVGPGVW
jgi:hypothetical protein